MEQVYSALMQKRCQKLFNKHLSKEMDKQIDFFFFFNNNPFGAT